MNASPQMRKARRGQMRRVPGCRLRHRTGRAAAGFGLDDAGLCRRLQTGIFGRPRLNLKACLRLICSANSQGAARVVSERDIVRGALVTESGAAQWAAVDPGHLLKTGDFMTPAVTRGSDRGGFVVVAYSVDDGPTIAHRVRNVRFLRVDGDEVRGRRLSQPNGGGSDPMLLLRNLI